MAKLKRWLCLTLTLALTAALTLPAHAVDPLANSFAAFLIDAEATDSPNQNLHVELYRRDNSGVFRVDDSVRYDCNVNRVAGKASFFLQPKADQVYAEVDYLTDMNGDGIYEMLDGEGSPASDLITAEGKLVPHAGTTYPLTNGQTYILSADTLRERAQEVLNARSAANSGQTLPTAGKPLPSPDSVLYFVTLHYNSPVDQTEYTLGYYLRIFDSVIIPSDVAFGSWYYDAVEYTLEEGLFSGTGADAFSPEGTVTRAQLAQILWRLGGSRKAKDAGFSDVAESDWFHDAVSWCSKEGLMTGTDTGFNPNAALTREQLALVLRQFAQYKKLDVTASHDLSQFSDGASASPWARNGLEWAVSKGLLSGYSDGTLHPGNGIKRCELAVVLRTFCQTMLDL